VTYATGGRVDAAAQPQVAAIVARVRGKHYGVRSLVHEIVQSTVFRQK
jgi:hypothetical protein